MWITLAGLDAGKEYAFQYYVGTKEGEVIHLADAYTEKTKVERNDSPSVEYKKAFGKDSIPAGKDIDHTIDLQLGGNPDVKVNGKSLDKSVNRSLGKQIGYLIKDFDYGTIIRKFTMVNRQ